MYTVDVGQHTNYFEHPDENQMHLLGQFPLRMLLPVKKINNFDIKARLVKSKNGICETELLALKK